VFRNLYSLNVFKSRIEGLDNKKLTELAFGEAEDLEKRKDKTPAGYQYIDPDAPEVKQLRHTIKKDMDEHIDSRFTEGEIWSQVTRTGESIPIHSHRFKQDWDLLNVSWVYYPQIPEGENLGGKIVFQTQLGAHQTLNRDFDPEVGDFIIFPSWLPHFTTPNISPEARVSISGNFYLNKDVYDEVVYDDRSGIKKLTGFYESWPATDPTTFHRMRVPDAGN
jgi:hypothetical protein